MKNIIKIASVAVVALALTQAAQATQISGAVTFFGTIQLGNSGVAVSTVTGANEVLNWYGIAGAGVPFVSSSSGNLSASTSPAATVTFATPWVFGPQASLWSYTGLDGDTFTFSLTTASISNDGNSISITGMGVITATGPVAFDATPASWNFTTQNPSAGGVFSFSAASGAPDGGATMMMLGIALSGVALLRKKLVA